RLHDQRAPGNTCLSSLAAPGWAEREGPAENDSKGCGGVMRVAPVGLVLELEPERCFELGCEVAALTHGHPSGILPAGVLAMTLRLMLDGEGLPAAFAAARQVLVRQPAHEETERALERAVASASTGGAPSPEALERLGGGWVGEEALAIAVYCALVEPGDVAAALRLAVNHSGDSDSTGAICGNLLGAALGEEALPAEWLADLELRDVIARLADDLVAVQRAEADMDGLWPAWWEAYPGW
ncbi:MAG TPA: ADP-ribosylglycohydrolase family protein, partial [Thermoanaerobaculia bacterium]|nr:ADP-ribosylglycohydrolase family protein [Thermoanaerobaculia bacterium]